MLGEADDEAAVYTNEILFEGEQRGFAANECESLA